MSRKVHIVEVKGWWPCETHVTYSEGEEMVPLSHKMNIVRVRGGSRVTHGTYSASQGVIAVSHKVHIVQVKGW